MRTRLPGLVLLAALGGCATGSTPALPDPSAIAAHEWDHGPPWGPAEVPWVAPPETYAYAPGYYYDPYPYYWGPRVGVGVGLGFGRGYWWRGHRYAWRGGYGGGPRFHHGGGGRRGRR